METTALRVIQKNLTENDKIIRFHHPSQDLTKVCTLVDVFYNGNIIEDKFFFLEKQALVNNVFDLAIPEKKYSVKIKFTTPYTEVEYKLEQLSVEII
jgi:hypothetical protein